MSIKLKAFLVTLFLLFVAITASAELLKRPDSKSL